MIFIILPPLIFLIWNIYKCIFYHSKKFRDIKNRISSHINECNLLNEHIEELKNTPLGFNQLDVGTSNYYDQSIYNYKRPKLNNIVFAPYVYNCSRIVCDNARKQPFKYICKYFNIKANDKTLSMWENVLNNYSAAENGKFLLISQKQEILKSISKNIPILIRLLNKKKLEQNLGFHEIDIKTIYFPKFIFNYVSSGGYASTRCEIILDINNLNRFIIYLSEIIKFKKSIQGQRALMTTNLRKQILARDDYTCQICGISSYTEKNLLLEVDHIKPLSKGGLTSFNNLQTLCWKCNRTKGNKVYCDSNNMSQIINIPNTSNKQDVCYNKINTPVQTIITNNVIATKQDIEIENKSQEPRKIDTKGEFKNMYDKEKGIYPAGQYLIGRDLPIGSYIFTARGDEKACVILYPSYVKYKKEEDEITYQYFEQDFHLSLMEENTYLVVENADIQKI